MSSEQTAGDLVARYLRANNFDKTLATFLDESGLPATAGAISPAAFTIEQVLAEKKSYDLSKNFTRLGIDEEADSSASWSVPSPKNPTIIDTLGQAANILHVAVDDVSLPDGEEDKSCVVASTADRTTNLLSTRPPFQQSEHEIAASESPVLSCAVVARRYLLTSSMAGVLKLYDLKRNKLVEERKDHAKYAVRIATSKPDTDGVWIATAAWDSKVLLYRLDVNSEEGVKIGSPRGIINLPTNPEDICFIEHPEILTPVLLVSRRDSTFLYFYTIPENNESYSMTLLGRQNLAPYSNAWIAFTPSSFAVSPTDPSIIGVATSTVPYMKIIIVRLLLPPPKAVGSSLMDAAPPVEMTQAAQARANLATQDREDAAILIHCSTLAPQTPYSTPGIAWRPDGSGVWVNADDGVIRGIETATGKIVALLKDGHEPAAKIRCLWSGWVQVGSSCEEWLLSGGFDRRLIVWRTVEAGGQSSA